MSPTVTEALTYSLGSKGFDMMEKLRTGQETIKHREVNLRIIVLTDVPHSDQSPNILIRFTRIDIMERLWMGRVTIEGCEVNSYLTEQIEKNTNIQKVTYKRSVSHLLSFTTNRLAMMYHSATFNFPLYTSHFAQKTKTDPLSSVLMAL